MKVSSITWAEELNCQVATGQDKSATLLIMPSQYQRILKPKQTT